MIYAVIIGLLVALICVVVYVGLMISDYLIQIINEIINNGGKE